MIEELWKNSAIIAKRNVDSNQTPISVKLTELKQIIDIHSCVVLNQLPDESYGINIEGFSEVYDIEDITTRTFKVDYANGVIYFHPYNVGKNIAIEYYGTGCTLLSASRIYTKYDKYGNVLETLEELIDKAKLYLQAIESIGGAVQVINKLDTDIATGTALHENLSTDIEIGIPLRDSLEEYIYDGTTINNKLEDNVPIAEATNETLRQTTIEATNLNADLENSIDIGIDVKEDLQEVMNQASDSISKINATGNKSLVIGGSQFVNNEYTWTHNMNSEDLIVNFMDSTTNEPLLTDYKIIDKNSILIRNSSEHPNVKVVLSSSFYQGNTLLGTNVEEFAGDSIGTDGGFTRLKDNTGYKYPVTKTDAIFMPNGTDKLTQTLYDLSDARDELIEARGSAQFLSDRLDYIDASLEENKKNIQIINPKEDNKYGIELLNFSGQGRPYAENGSSKGIVVHNYTDSEAVVIDNVGEAPTIRLAGARNSTRRADKSQDYCARPNHLQIVQAFMNEDNVTHRNVTLWNLDWAGNIWYRSTMPTETKAPSIMTATQELADSGFFAMTMGSFYETRLILNLLYKNGSSALKFFMDGAKNTIMQSSDGGIKSIAYKLDNTIESTEGNVIFKALNGETFINTDGVNKIVGRFVQTPPTSKTSSGKRGDFSADTNYIYVCYATNAWHRIAKDSTW